MSSVRHMRQGEQEEVRRARRQWPAIYSQVRRHISLFASISTSQPASRVSRFTSKLGRCLVCWTSLGLLLGEEHAVEPASVPPSISPGKIQPSSPIHRRARKDARRPWGRVASVITAGWQRSRVRIANPHYRPRLTKRLSVDALYQRG